VAKTRIMTGQICSPGGANQPEFIIGAENFTLSGDNNLGPIPTPNEAEMNS
jgi:hypothetical protein